MSKRDEALRKGLIADIDPRFTKAQREIWNMAFTAGFVGGRVAVLSEIGDWAKPLLEDELARARERREGGDGEISQ